jgi:hypothetical protein
LTSCILSKKIENKGHFQKYKRPSKIMLFGSLMEYSTIGSKRKFLFSGRVRRSVKLRPIARVVGQVLIRL